MKIRTVSELCDVLDSDMKWRKRELTSLRFMLQDVREHQAKPLLRAAVCLLYAHWEGFIRGAANVYLAFVAYQGLRYRDLTPNFVAFGLRRDIAEAGKSERPILHTTLVTTLMSELSDPARIDCSNAMPQRNVNSRELREVLALVGLDEREYLSKGPLLDEKLLAHRNRIAHGERADLELADYYELHAEIVGLVERFNTDVQNAAATERYRRRAA